MGRSETKQICAQLGSSTHAGQSPICKIDCEGIEKQQPQLRVKQCVNRLAEDEFVVVHEAGLVMNGTADRHFCLEFVEKDGLAGRIRQEYKQNQPIC